MKNAYIKDIWRTITKQKKRFLSIAVIVTLGMTMVCGLRASCVDLRQSADKYFDDQNLFDIRILSTLGLTEEDVEALQELNEVKMAEGGYSETVYTKMDGIRKSIEVHALSQKDFNQPYLLEGDFPKAKNEIVITQNYMTHTGLKVGDWIVLDEEADNLKSEKYQISGIIIDSFDINSTEGSMGFRSTATTDYVGYVAADAVDSDIYTVVYLSLHGTEEINCYTEEYDAAVEKVVQKIESKMKKQREQARYDEIYEEAMEEWLDGEQEMKDEFAKADQEIADAQKEISDAKKELADGRDELADGKAELIDGEKELKKKEADGKRQIANGRKEIKAGYRQLEEAKAGYEQAKQAKQMLKEQESILKDQVIANSPEFQAYKQMLKEKEAEFGPDAVADEWKAFNNQVEDVIMQMLPDEWNMIQSNLEKAEAGIAQYEANLPELEASKRSLAKAEKELEAQEAVMERQIASAWQEIAKGWKELREGEKKLNEGVTELAEGEKELSDNILEYQREKKKAEKELADAKEEIDDIDMTKWYVQDRTALSAFTNVKGDADSIQAIGDIFPVLFLIIAVLISLTTITRMVDEERSLIGTYQALGFTHKEIRRKYVIYASLACLIGGVCGDIGGYIILPKFLFTVFQVMYLLPEYTIQFDALFGIGGIIMFEAGILGATIYACERKLKRTPAILMRPKAPRAGSRVLLERIDFIWKRLSFLNKVTARNIFRYKKRMIMTVVGIMGCTALLLCGFTIKNTVSEMVPQQYSNIYQYDLMAVSMDEDFDVLQRKMKTDKEIGAFIPVRIETMEIFNSEGKKESVQLTVVPDGKELESYIALKDKKGQNYFIEDGEIFLTKNASRILDLNEGDSALFQNVDLVEVTASVSKIVQNYFGNVVYMTEATYEKLFGEYKANGVYAKFSDDSKDIYAYTNELSRMDEIMSATSTEEMAAEFDSAFALINMVVYIVLVLAAMLAFVVLFTLSNTNISERERELATIKVLGFYNNEVHSYVNKETILLTMIGVICGMPAGFALGRYVMGILQIPSLEFYIALYPESYAFAAAITMVFALMVNLLTNGTLNKINMIEALKSVE